MWIIRPYQAQAARLWSPAGWWAATNPASQHDQIMVSVPWLILARQRLGIADRLSTCGRSMYLCIYVSCMHACMDGRTDGRMDVRTDGWMYCTYVCIYIYVCVYSGWIYRHQQPQIVFRWLSQYQAITGIPAFPVGPIFIAQGQLTWPDHNAMEAMAIHFDDYRTSWWISARKRITLW